MDGQPHTDTALRRANQTRDALYRISEAAHGADNLRALCDGVHQVIKELFPEDTLFLTFYDPTTRLLSTPDHSSDRPDGWEEETIQPGTALAEVIRTGQTLLASRDPGRQGVGLRHSTLAEPASWLGVPLLANDAVLGVLTIESQNRHTARQLLSKADAGMYSDKRGA